jgi:adenylate kinase
MTNLTTTRVVLLLGPPGCGKGTQAAQVGSMLRLPHISTGDLFRDHIRKQTSLGKQAKTFIDAGKLVPDALVLDMLFDRISSDDCKLGYLLDGFPRTVPQAEALQQRLGETPVVVLSFALPDKVLIERITGRLVCACGKTYHRTFDPPKTAGVCNACKQILSQRPDDKEEVVRKRLQVYRLQTAPLLQFYREHLREISSTGTKDEVFKQVLEALQA